MTSSGLRLPPAQTLQPREVPLGGTRAMYVRRTLPHKDIRTIGAFCFVDHYGPSPTAGSGGHPMVVPPHPHIGIQTVSWLLSGTVDHHDTVGSVQRIHPGELNVMTTGNGIAHSEYSVGDLDLHRVQLWVALPSEVRDQSPHFEHHADLPSVADHGLTARVVMGSFFGEESKAATYSPLVCAELILAAGRVTLPVNKNFEHGLLLTEGAATVDGEPVTRGDLAYRPTGRSAIDIEAPDDATLLLIGGKPFEEDLLMWWNFVGRSQDEIASAREDWEAGRRFGSVVEDDHLPLPAPELPTIRLLPRPSRRR